MAISDTGTVPETLPRDAGAGLDRPDAIEPETERVSDRPEADADSTETVLRDQREASGGGVPTTPDEIREAIAASEAEVGAAATSERIRSGELLAADGSSLLEGLSQGQRAEMAQQYEADIRERADGPDVELTSEMRNLKNLEEKGIQPILAKNFADPEAAMDRLKSLNETEIEALANGDASVLGDLRERASLDENESRSLSAFADDWDQNPEAAALIERAWDQEHARDMRDDLDARDRGDDGTRKHEQDPARKSLDDETLSLQDRMQHQIAYQAAAIPQI